MQAKRGIYHKNGTNTIELFHNKVARHLTNRHIHKIKDTDIWFYPNMQDVFDAGLLPIDQYIYKRKKKLLAWAHNRPIYHETQTLAELMGNACSFWGVDINPPSDDE
jgi:UDP:flavonoid glycosyltransferase YjiC (YdhE family)